MRIAVNLLPLKTGGGVQVALDFIRQIEKFGNGHQWFIVSRDISAFSRLETGDNILLHEKVKDRLCSRLFFERFRARQFVSNNLIDVVYTQFGPVWPLENSVNIAGCAYSNLFYPEFDFWGRMPLHKRMIKRFIDWVRLRGVLRSDVVIFETEDLANRMLDQFKLGKPKVKYVRAAVSSLVSNSSIHEETRRKVEGLKNGVNILLLSGYHVNKNIEFILDICSRLREKKQEDVRFILTLPEKTKEVRKFLSEIRREKLQNMVINIGPVPQEGCCELYRACDYTILPSMLESFSNTIAETWEMGNPLLISDFSWARSLCGKGAAYFKYLDADSFIEKLDELMNDKLQREMLVEEGRNQLLTYPTSEQRFKAYLDIIERTGKSA